MNLTGKHRRIGVLMLISQLLLMGFAAYWLNGQYNAEKEALIKEVTLQYKASYETALDSMLVENYIQPVLGDSIRIYSSDNVPAVFMADSFRVRASVDSLKDVSSKGNSIIRINIDAEDDSSGQSQNAANKKIEEALLLRSVRLIMNHAGDSSINHIMSLHRDNIKLDSILFITDLESRIDNEAINIDLTWIGEKDGASKIVARQRGIVIGDWTDAVPSIGLGNTRAYILGRIFPQIIFALLLVFLTATAFLIAYRSLRKQTMLNQMRNNFISNMSHELKTPVSTVKIAIEAIRNFDLKKDASLADEYLEAASKEIKRLELLISKVLDNTIIEHDSSILRHELIDVNGLIKSAIESLAPRVLEAKAELVLHNENELLLKADPMYLEGVIINLLDNSLKYANENPRIDIRTEKEEEFAAIHITDNGPGIPAQYIDRIFEKFFRIPTSNIHNVKGYGLGLSFASLIIKLHGGEIKVRNNKVGCSFIIKLPLEKE